mgnify:FL=1
MKKQIDLSQYKAFPADYVVPKDTPIVSLITTGSVRRGLIGRAIEERKDPECDFFDGTNNLVMHNHMIAPLDPKDHPEYVEENSVIADHNSKYIFNPVSKLNKPNRLQEIALLCKQLDSYQVFTELVIRGWI